MKLIYIAAPFTAGTAWGVAENVRRAEQWGKIVLEAAQAMESGSAWPIIPHANTSLFHGSCDEDHAYEGTMEMLRRCDGMFCVTMYKFDGTISTGVQKELAEASRMNIPIEHASGKLDLWVPHVRQHAVDYMRYWIESISVRDR